MSIPRRGQENRWKGESRIDGDSGGDGGYGDGFGWILVSWLDIIVSHISIGLIERRKK